MRKTKFIEGQYYHIYNRGTEKRKIFMDNFDFGRFLLSVKLMNNEKDGLMIAWRDYKENHPSTTSDEFLRLSLRNKKPLVALVTYSLIANHFHFILKQIAKRGIEIFMHRLGTGYTMYFNKKYIRSGALFQGRFKSTHIMSNEMLLYLSAYVNFNSEIHGAKKAEKYIWCSLPEYLNKGAKKVCEKKIVLDQFRSLGEYYKFASMQSRGVKRKREMAKILFE